MTKTKILTIEIEVEVDYDFQPEEKPEGESGYSLGYPGRPESLEINSVECNGVDITKALKRREIGNIEAEILDQIAERRAG